ncbi:MAG: aminotransferase class IV [Chthoniobacterales bacterium]
MSSHSYQWHSGSWQPFSGIPLTDRAFRHGMSAFATIRIYRGKYISLPEHLAKLRLTCAQLGLRLPPDDSASLPPGIEHGLARITVTAGDGSFLDPLNDGRLFLVLTPTPAEPPRPRSLALLDTTHTPLFAGLKIGNYWPQIDARRRAAVLHCDEAVLVNASHHVISASLANLFACIDGLLLTPRVNSGARAGVTRDWVLSREDIIVGDFHPEQLREASDIFLTSSAYGIAPIACLDGKPLPCQSIGTRLQADYLHWLAAQ